MFFFFEESDVEVAKFVKFYDKGVVPLSLLKASENYYFGVVVAVDIISFFGVVEKALCCNDYSCCFPKPNYKIPPVGNADFPQMFPFSLLADIFSFGRSSRN